MSRPLWEVMQSAYFEGRAALSERHGYAAEIRALAEIIEQRNDRDPGETADWLRAEADRAEGQA